MDYVQEIRRLLSYPAQLEQLAEECTELAQAALKYARILRDENPTPVTKDEAVDQIREEIGDVYNCLNVLGYQWSLLLGESKLKRWYIRLLERPET